MLFKPDGGISIAIILHLQKFRLLHLMHILRLSKLEEMQRVTLLILTVPQVSGEKSVFWTPETGKVIL